MKIYSLLKQGALIALFAVAASSCIKSEASFNIGLQQAYVVQSQLDTDVQYTPYILIASFSQIESATLTYNGAEYEPNTVGTNGTMLEFSSEGYYGFTATPTIPTGAYAIYAIEKGTKKTASMNFTFEASATRPVIGAYTTTNITYTPEEGIKATWEVAQNASGYCLIVEPVVETEYGGMVSGGKILQAWTYADSSIAEKDQTSGTYKPQNAFAQGQQLRIYLAAYSSATNEVMIVRPDGKAAVDITWGEALIIPD